MQSNSGSTASVWMELNGQAIFPQLDRDLHTDVCIIGAGIAGLTVAYTLATFRRKNER
jgi:ribulose 1,5-bisphosphate synthetase/thiazole synthase